MNATWVKALAGLIQPLIKFISKQLTWATAFLVLSAPIAFLFLEIFDRVVPTFVDDNPDLYYPGINLYVIFYITTFVGMFGARWVSKGLDVVIKQE